MMIRSYIRNIYNRFKHYIERVTLNRVERRHSLVGPPKLWKLKRDFQINFLKNAGLEPQHYLLDIGCGTLRGGIPLIDYLNVGNYTGIERRRKVLEEGGKT